MPVCKNNPKRYFKGTEPSPKGRGFCASNVGIAKKMKGKDKKMWIVRKVGKSKRWVKFSIAKKKKTPAPKKKKKKNVTKKSIDKSIARKPRKPRKLKGGGKTPLQMLQLIAKNEYGAFDDTTADLAAQFVRKLSSGLITPNKILEHVRRPAATPEYQNAYNIIANTLASAIQAQPRAIAQQKKPDTYVYIRTLQGKASSVPIYWRSPVSDTLVGQEIIQENQNFRLIGEGDTIYNSKTDHDTTWKMLDDKVQKTVRGGLVGLETITLLTK